MLGKSCSYRSGLSAHNSGMATLAGLRSAGQRQDTGIKSLHLLEGLVEEVMGGPPGLFREALGTESTEDQPAASFEFPSLSICAAVEEQEEDSGALLSFRTPVSPDFAKASKKACMSYL